MERLIEFNGKPDTIRTDNGSEFFEHVFKKWCDDKDIEIKYIQPGKPMQNAYIERFNRHYREDILDVYIFENIQDVRNISENWKDDYNHYHPHKSLMGMSPIQFKKKIGASP